jgi:outer membrane protein OmpA-like peptidoglycan-associated protein
MLVNTRKKAFYTMLLAIILVISAQVVFGQETASRPRRVSKATSERLIPSGKKAQITGNVTRIGQDSFSVCDMAGAETVVQFASSTRITTHRRGIFRGADTRDKNDLILGLLVTVQGRGNDAGELVATHVRYHDSAHKAATEVDARAIPIEREQDRIAGQLDETTIVATNARKEAKVAQESADKAQSTADLAKDGAALAQRTALAAHEKIWALDDFDVAEALTVTFKAGSAVLTDEAKARLDEFSLKTANARGYLIEICAFASKEGGTDYNHRLSQARAEVVKDYLIDAGKIVPRRIVSPYSGGVNNPIADNKTREGRMQNRRAEVKLLVSKGLAEKEAVANK